MIIAHIKIGFLELSQTKLVLEFLPHNMLNYLELSEARYILQSFFFSTTQSVLLTFPPSSLKDVDLVMEKEEGARGQETDTI